MAANPSLNLIYPKERRINVLKKNLVLLANLIRFNSLHHRQSTLLMGLPAFMRKAIWDKAKANAGFTPLPLSADAQAALDELKASGIVKVKRNFAELADYINAHYATAKDELPQDAHLRQFGLTVNKSLPFSDPRLAELLFDTDLCALVCNYYGMQGFYRDDPLLTKEVVTPNAKPQISGIFHSDGFHQVTFMLLLDELTMDDTHMEYALGSHIELQPSYSRKEIDQAQVEKQFKLAHVIGEKGSLYIFDSEGLHRRGYRKNSRRTLLNVNVTPGIYLFTCNKYDSTESIFGTRDYPQYVKNFMRKAVKKAA